MTTSRTLEGVVRAVHVPVVITIAAVHAAAGRLAATFTTLAPAEHKSTPLRFSCPTP